MPMRTKQATVATSSKAKRPIMTLGFRHRKAKKTLIVDAWAGSRIEVFRICDGRNRRPLEWADLEGEERSP